MIEVQKTSIFQWLLLK